MPISTSDSASSVVRVDARYLLLTFVPYYVDRDGAVWLERLWHRDFVAHFRYLPRLILAAPVRAKAEGPSDLVKVDVPEGASLQLVPLPKADSTLEGLRTLPVAVKRLWDAIGEADVVHSGVAGWPIPPGWIANPIAMARGRTLVLVIESANWRATARGEHRASARARELVTEALARFFVRRADVNLFTHPGYQRTLARPDTRGCHITPAAWIDEADIATEEQARWAWAVKARSPVRLLFAARLLPEKGTELLLAALESLDRGGVRVGVDVIGEGPRRAAFVEASQRLSSVQVRLLDPIPYGRAFFELVRKHHAVLLPNLGDEQPRVLFDAYAQAVPAIAFDTDGLRPYVEDGVTGWLVPRGEDALAGALERATSDVQRLAALGMRAREEARRYTHRAMHEERSRILAAAIAGAARPRAFSARVGP